MPLDERERYDSIYSTIPYIKKVHKSLEDTCIGAAQKALEFGMEWIKKFFSPKPYVGAERTPNVMRIIGRELSGKEYVIV